MTTIGKNLDHSGEERRISEGNETNLEIQFKETLHIFLIQRKNSFTEGNTQITLKVKMIPAGPDPYILQKKRSAPKRTF